MVDAIEQEHQNLVNVWEHFRTDLAFLIDLVPILPDSLLWRAVDLATHMNTDFDPLRFWGTPLADLLDPVYTAHMDPPLYALLLETLAARLPHHGRLAFLEEALTHHPKLACYLPSHLLQEALIAVRSMKRAELRPALLAALATRFPYPQQDALLHEALAAVSTLWRGQREKALRQMTAFLPKPMKKDLLQRTLEIANSFEVALTRARVFTVLAPIVPTSVKNEVRQEAINAAMAIRDDSAYKGEVIEKLFAILPPSWRRDLVLRAIANARAMKDERDRVWAIRYLLPILTPPLRGEILTRILAIVRETEDLSTRAELIEILIPFLPKFSKKALLKDGLKIIRAIDEDQRAAVVTSLAPHFAGMVTRKELLDVVARVREIEDEEDRAEAFVALIPLAPEPLKNKLLQEVFATLYSLEDGFGYFWVVKDLIRVTPMALQGQILQEVMTITEQIRNESIQARNIEFMAPYLTQNPLLLWQAFTMALKMWNNRHQTRTLRYLYRHFPKEVLPEALARTVAVEDEEVRAWALVEIGVLLTDEQLLREALEAALAIQGQYARTLALAGLAFALNEREQASPELVRQVLITMPDEQRYAVLEDMLLSFWMWYQFFIITAAAESSPTQEPIPVPGWSRRFQPLPPLRPVQERIVSTGFSSYEQADVPISAKMPLACAQQYYFWLEVGPPVAESIEDSPGPLPVERLPPDAQLIVVIFALDEELQVTPGADVGAPELQPDGSVHVLTQPEQPISIAPGADLSARRLFFPIKAPKRPGTFRFDCHIYYEQTLIQSRQIRIQVMKQPVPRSIGRANYSILDYSLSKTLDVASLAAVGPHSVSMILKSKGDGTNRFLFLSKDGTEVVKGNVTFSEQKLAGMIKKMRGALRRASWGDEETWNSKKQYRYAGSKNVQRLKEDLVLFAIRGYRFYCDVINALSTDFDQREQLRKLMTQPGLIQFALEQSSSAILPLSLVYDYPLSTNKYTDWRNYKFCPAFEEALSTDKPLETLACFHGACPSRGSKEEKTIICPSGFWGYRHAFGMPLSVENRSEVVQEITYQQIIQVAVGVSTDPKFTERRVHEQALKLLRPEWNNAGTGSTGWYYADNRDSMFALLKQVQPHLVYFYCHGGVNDEVPYIQVGYDESVTVITPDDLYSEAIRWRNQGPLVFINGCQTTALEPKMPMAFAQAFVNGPGAAGVIGTEISVFEHLACAFAEECLRSFLGGLPIGEAIRRARLTLLKQGNPLGLIYVPFVVGGLRLVPASP